MIEYSFSMYELEYYLLVLVRVLFFIYKAPFFGMSNVPRRVKVAFGVFLAYLVYRCIPDRAPLQYDGVLGYTVIVLREALTGLMIGLAADMCNTIVLFAGRLVDMENGLGMASEMDPTTKEQTSVSGVFYQYTVTLILLLTNLHRYLIGALVDTFTLIPINGAIFHGDKLLNALIAFLGGYLNVGFRICLPVFCVLTITNCILGIMAKVAPQMNMFAVGMQIKLLMGLGVMFLTVGMLPYVADYVFTEMKTMMVSFVEAMMA